MNIANAIKDIETRFIPGEEREEYCIMREQGDTLLENVANLNWGQTGEFHPVIEKHEPGPGLVQKLRNIRLVFPVLNSEITESEYRRRICIKCCLDGIFLNKE